MGTVSECIARMTLWHVNVPPPSNRHLTVGRRTSFQARAARDWRYLQYWRWQLFHPQRPLWRLRRIWSAVVKHIVFCDTKLMKWNSRLLSNTYHMYQFTLTISRCESQGGPKLYTQHRYRSSSCFWDVDGTFSKSLFRCSAYYLNRAVHLGLLAH